MERGMEGGSEADIKGREGGMNGGTTKRHVSSSSSYDMHVSSSDEWRD